MAGSITITGLSSAEPSGQRAIGPMTDTGSAVIGETLAISLASGDNTVTIPTGAVGALLIPPASGTATLKVRSSLNAADAGLPIASTNRPMYYPFPAAAPTTLIINSSATQAAFLTIAFI